MTDNGSPYVATGVFDNWTMEAGLGLLRHVLTGLGGGLISEGLVSQSQWTDSVGAIITLVGVIWSVCHKWSNRRRPAAQ